MPKGPLLVSHSFYNDQEADITTQFGIVAIVRGSHVHAAFIHQLKKL